MTTDIIIYHNPECGTSRNTLALIRNAGIEPHVVEYLKTPPSRAMLEQLIERAGLSPRDLLRQKGTPYADLGLDNTDLAESELVDAMMAQFLVNAVGPALLLKHFSALLPKEKRSVFASLSARVGSIGDTRPFPQHESDCDIRSCAARRL